MILSVASRPTFMRRSRYVTDNALCDVLLTIGHTAVCTRLDEMCFSFKNLACLIVDIVSY